MLAVALLDEKMMAEHYAPEPILADDVPALLRRVEIEADPGLSARFPAEMPADPTATLANGTRFQTCTNDYGGFPPTGMVGRAAQV